MLDRTQPMLATEKDLTWVPQAAPRLLLWVDGVGGFLLCLGHRLTLGQVNLEAMPDVALLADISRHHATLQRDAEGCFLEAVRSVQLNGQPVQSALLRNDDRLTLGRSCQLVYRQPTPVSATARLDVVSGHRFHQPVNAVLLMADTLVLGASAQAHVLVEELKSPVILYRQGTTLGVRYDGNLTINGETAQTRRPVEMGQRVCADTVSFALERVRSDK